MFGQNSMQEPQRPIFLQLFDQSGQAKSAIQSYFLIRSLCVCATPPLNHLEMSNE